MRKCSTCIHPNRAIIDELLREGKLSLWTIGGRHGLTASALHRHRTRHLELPILGDLHIPENWEMTYSGPFLYRWNGRVWELVFTNGEVPTKRMIPQVGRRVGGKRVFRLRPRTYHDEC